MNVERIGEHSIPVPQRETEGAAGFDLCAADEFVILPRFAAKIPTGFAWEIPEGSVGLVCPRSGMAAKYGITVLNAPGIVDSDYRGEVCVLLVNHGLREFRVEFGDRIAQLVVVPLHAAALESRQAQEVHLLSYTERGDAGFGSTGKAA